MQVQSRHSRSRLKDKVMPQKILMRRGLEGMPWIPKRKGLEGMSWISKRKVPGRDAMDTEDEELGRDTMDTEEGPRRDTIHIGEGPGGNAYPQRNDLEGIICTRKES